MIVDNEFENWLFWQNITPHLFQNSMEQVSESWIIWMC